MRTLLALLFAATAFAQQPERPQPKTIELKHANAERLVKSGVLNPFVQPGTIHIDPTGRYLIVHAISTTGLAGAEELIRKLDVPARSVELTFHIVSAGAESANVPPALEPVVKQLRNAFVYPAYKLLDSAMVRTRDGSEGFVQGAMPGNAKYRIHFRPIRLSEGSPNTIRIDGLRLQQTLLAGAQPEELNITADVDVREGQKVVVGKSTMREAAVFLVVSAKVID